MKKMMIFAVMMSMMLMPAQMMAKNDKNAKPRVENRVENKKDKEKKDDKFKEDKKGKDAECSLEGLVPKLKLQYFGHLM